ncbi:hypothetical protein [Halorubrum tebenquichense]|uniref:Uncharacterized protein n=1 Tax=Halorubrum tebenquichense DSM 14210 TaxID=1227485 RepID=M0DNL6_9EURY|nr:hypothetical protein C472_09371 [Halorubrum tebenquichense DSM 14210]
MPSQPASPDPPDSPGGTDAEAADSADGPRRRSASAIASAGSRASDPARTVGLGRDRDRRPGYHDRVRVAALAAEVERLEAERDRLADRVAALERAVESEAQRRQQVIDNYERVVAARSESDAASDASRTASTRPRPLAAVAAGMERVAAWLRRADG